MIRTLISSLVQPPALLEGIINSGVRVLNGVRLDIVISIGPRLDYKPVDAQPRSLWIQRVIGNL